MTDLTIIGGGLAGSEAAYQAAERGLKVKIIEMRPVKMTAAHQGGDCAELVCSNSFRSDDDCYNAVGLLHHEMRVCNSLIMQCADKHKVPAGGALAVDREAFSAEVTAILKAHPNIELTSDVITKLPDADAGHVIIATGPLTDTALAEDIQAITGQESLAFFDAIAPIVYKDSIDFDKAWMQSRYDKGEGADYINCAMNEEEYNRFYDALMAAEKTEFKEWEKDTPYFEACLPVEVMAERGRQTLCFGPLKPVGLRHPNATQPHHAVVQLRQDNKTGELYNMVGFQTKLKYNAQKAVFSLIPGLENAEFARLGGIHRNSFIKSPLLLDATLRLKSRPNIRFAGQITGCEGYIESAAVGLAAGRFVTNEIQGQDIIYPNRQTALGSLLAHITGEADHKYFQPMNINFGLFPPLDETFAIIDGRKRKLGKKDKAERYSQRAKLQILDFAQCA
ncbi:MAG: methylenetetrahydrofolate--tRNA-(uracil-5-)-methyltransferase [Alphaproteobacteria bacterium]|jgi:methylenetetrahydrofolate--tRNA-(uracil-5-)-methyltransferase